jgi:hypothetical protein
MANFPTLPEVFTNTLCGSIVSTVGQPSMVVGSGANVGSGGDVASVALGAALWLGAGVAG